MARPGLKRKRLHSTPPQKRVANTSGPSPRLELQQKLQTKEVGIRPSDSDDSDKLVKAAPQRRNLRNVQRQEIYASGGLAAQDTPGAHPSLRRSRIAGSSAISTRQSHAIGSSMLQNNNFPETRPYQTSPLSQAPENAPISQKTQLPQPANSIAPATRRQIAATPLAGSPTAAAASILGTLKSRRRQNSILRLVGNNDSSSFSLGDEADFLPDAESTPLDLAKTTAAVPTPFSSISNGINPRKRKFSPPESQSDETPHLQRSSPAASSLPLQLQSIETELLTLHESAQKTQQPRQARNPRDEDDFMAPPQSSSSLAPDSSPAKPREPSPAKGQRRTRQANIGKSITTEELQRLMPKRAKSRKVRNQATTPFDIPSDTSQLLPPPNASDEESFLPSRGNPKRQRQRQQKANVTAKRHTAAARGGSRKQTHSTLTPIKAANSRVTKSPSQQPQSRSRSSRVIAKPIAAAAAKNMDHPRSSRRPRGKSGGEGDKENRPGPTSGDLDERREEGGGEEDSFSRGGSDVDVDVEVDDAVDTQIKQQQDMFAAIDAWDMDFEEVDVSSHGSDPMMR